MDMEIILDTLDKVNTFVAVAQTRPQDIELTQGKYIVNAKSIMGVFSLDLTKPVTAKSEQADSDFFEQIKIYKKQD